MKLGHAAALALLEWILVLPPHPPPRLILGLDQLKGPYKSYEHCREMIDRLGREDGHPEWTVLPDMSRWLAECRCVQQNGQNPAK